MPSARMLLASHIKPWAESRGSERVDPLNGLAACPTHDAAFENYLIAVDAGGRVPRSPSLDKAVASDTAWAQFFEPAAPADFLLLSDGASRPDLGCADRHRAQVEAEWWRISLSLTGDRPNSRRNVMSQALLICRMTRAVGGYRPTFACSNVTIALWSERVRAHKTDSIAMTTVDPISELTRGSSW